MQPQPQIFQPRPQMMPPNPQFQNMNNIIPPNNLQQIIQVENPNKCEKMSKCLTGNTNIPITVFIILMSSMAYHISTVLFDYSFLTNYNIAASFFDFIFALFVWSKTAIKLEINTSTVKYGYLYLANLLIISVFTLSFPLKRVWNFVLFETLLIAINNKDRKMKVCCFKISGKYLFVLTIIYHIVFNIFNLFSILFTIAYAFIYKKFLIYKLNVSNEKIQSYENFCLFGCLKYRFKTFITLEDVLAKEQNRQGNNNNINNNINGSFVPNNMYPNYYSGIVQGNPNQAPIQPGMAVQQNPPVVQPGLDLNQSSSRYDLANSN